MNFSIKTLIAVGLVLGASFLAKNSSIFLFSNPEVRVPKEILAGQNFILVANQAGIATTTANKILEETKKIYDLSQISAGKDLTFIYDKNSGNLKELRYEIDKENELRIKNNSTTTIDHWVAEKLPIEYKVIIAEAKGTIENSLYETIVSQNLDQRLALALAEMFAWQIDFATQIQKGDSFKVIYEKKYRGDTYDHPGKILATEFINSGERFQGFYFNPVRDREGSQRASVSNGVKGDKTKEGYYDEAGNSLQKVFLKAPLQYKYVSSGFSYSRFNPILQVYTKHRGIDYAAAFGTPAVAVGDGTVVQAGWNGEYGISVKVRHNETYTTVYGHFSSLAKGIRVGAKVRQGQIIGYVGSTGLSTGPHLHYEMHKFGSFINPFTEKIPAGEPIKDEDRSAFQVVLDKYTKNLDKI